MDAVMKKGKETEKCRRRRRRRQHSRTCATNCAEWRSQCPGISMNQTTSTTNGLPLPPSSNRHPNSFTPHYTPSRIGTRGLGLARRLARLGVL